MTNKQICYLYKETAKYANPDAFASDAALFITTSDETDVALLEQLRMMWHVANDPFKVLMERMGLNQTQCSTRFCIPLRTVQGWAGETRIATPYTRLMMAEAVGLLDIRDHSDK